MRLILLTMNFHLQPRCAPGPARADQFGDLERRGASTGQEPHTVAAGRFYGFKDDITPLLAALRKTRNETVKNYSGK